MKTIALLLLLSTALASAGATLSGRVTDANGAVVVGAEIEIVNTATNAAIKVITNNQGLFVAPSLPAGTYSVTITQSGFQKLVKQNIVLTVDDRATENFSLAPVGVQDAVTITGRSSLIERDSPAVATVVDRQFVENLPLNGRSFQSLLELTPGVTLTRSSTASTGQFSINGQRTNANYFMVDGVGANFGASLTAQAFQQGGGTLPALTVLGGFNNLASVDALQEFRVQTSTYSPEFGRSPGGQISIATRSGGNSYTGTLFNYFRNEALDATDFFDKINRVPKRKLRQNNFGGVLGGPVRLPKKVFGPLGYDGRDRTFFFISYEGLRLVQPQAGIFRARVPSLEARQAATGAWRSVLNAFPLPNAPRVAADGDPEGTARYIAGLSYPTTLDAISARFDQQFSSKLSAFVRYAQSPSDQNFLAFPSQENRFTKRTEFVTAGATWTISPRWVSDTRFNYSTDRGTFDFVGVARDGAILPPDNLVFPSFAPRESTAVSLILGTGGGVFSSANLTQGKTLGAKQQQFNFVQNMTWVAGNHEFKFGADYRLLRPIQDSRSLSISYSFTTPAARLNGVPNQIQVQAFAPVTEFRVHNFSGFVQDTWRIARHFSLSYGTRYEVNPPLAGDRLPYQLDGLNNPLTATIARPGTRQWNTTWNNFAPRIGFGWTISEKHNLVARGGYGLFYDTAQGTALRGYSSFPYNVFKTITAPAQLRFPANDLDLQPPPYLDQAQPPYSSSFFVFDRNLQLPRTQQWSLTLEKSLGQYQTISVGYVAASARRLLRAEQLQNFNRAFAQSRFGIDQAVIVLNPVLFGPDLNSTAPLGGSTVNITRNAAASDYHSLQVQFRRRLSRGLQVLASYTWAKSLDDVSDETITGIPFSSTIFRLERGPSDFDIRHTFSTAVTYDLPLIPGLRESQPYRAVFGNWAIDAVGRARSATPFNAITQNFDVLNIGTTRRVDLKPGVPVYLNNPSVPGGKRLNPDAFVVGAAGRQGTLGRNSLRGFGATQIDLSVRRQFALREKLRLQFRAEFFNVLNQANFADPAGSFGFSTFGVSQSMLGRALSGNTGATQTSPSPGFNSLYQIGGPRSIQFALKLLF
jgi:hypothetical protein